MIEQNTYRLMTLLAMIRCSESKNLLRVSNVVSRVDSGMTYDEGSSMR